MSHHGFLGTLAFGAAAAMSLVFFQVVASPAIDAQLLAALHGTLCLVVYCAWLADSARGAVCNGLLALAGAILSFALAQGAEAGWLGLAIVLGVLRSGRRIAAGSTRAIVVEAGLLLAGFAMALWLSGGGALGSAFGLWGFALVQSLYFLVPGIAPRIRSGDCVRDPFEEARDRLSRLLDG